MALAAMLSAQAYISLMDRIDHAQGHAHFANPLAGGVEFKFASHSKPSPHHHAQRSGGHHHSDDTADHHGAVAAHHTHGSGEHHHSHSPADHQHGGDAALVFLAAHHFVLPGAPLPAYRYETASPKLVSFRPHGPDHPPKTSSEIRV